MIVLTSVGNCSADLRRPTIRTCADVIGVLAARSMKLPNWMVLVLLSIGVAGCVLGIVNLYGALSGKEAHLQGISVQITALSVLIVVAVFLLTALVTQRMDSIRKEILVQDRKGSDAAFLQNARDLTDQLRKVLDSAEG